VALQLFIVPPVVNSTITIGTAALAAWRGDWRVRLLAAAMVVAHLLDSFLFPYRLAATPRFALGARVVVEDLAVLAACLLCLRDARGWWVVWATAFAFLLVFTGALFIGFHQIPWLAFASGERIWKYALCATLVWGALADRAVAAPRAAA
jgi:hypothetical protein